MEGNHFWFFKFEIFKMVAKFLQKRKINSFQFVIAVVYYIFDFLGIFGPRRKANITGITYLANVLENISDRIVLGFSLHQQSHSESSLAVEVQIRLKTLLVGLKRKNRLMQSTSKA